MLNDEVPGVKEGEVRKEGRASAVKRNRAAREGTLGLVTSHYTIILPT